MLPTSSTATGSSTLGYSIHVNDKAYVRKGSVLAMDAFETAKNKFISSLSAQEAATLGTLHTAEDVLGEVRKAEENHRSKSSTRRYTKKIEPFLKGVEQYGKAIDVFVNVYPEALSVIWGSARLILHVCDNNPQISLC
jgi:hypothetical protein